MKPKKEVSQIPQKLTALKYANLKHVGLNWVYVEARQGHIPGAYRRDGQWRIRLSAPAKESQQ